MAQQQTRPARGVDYWDAAEQKLLEERLQALRSTTDVDGVGAYPATHYNMTSWNPNRVLCRVKLADGKYKPLLVVCSAKLQLKSEAALELIRQVEKTLKITIDAQGPPVNGSQSESGSSSSTGAPPSAFEYLALVQQAKKAAARAEKAEAAALEAEAKADAERARALAQPMEACVLAYAEVERVKALLDAYQQAPKRQRVEGAAQQQEVELPKEPPYRSRPYGQWGTVRVWLSYEGEIWNRRRVPLSDGKPARQPEQMPRGENGPLDHWRRGLVGALQDWAEGSKADAAKLVISLIKRLGLEVCAAHPSTPPSACTSLECMWGRFLCIT